MKKLLTVLLALAMAFTMVFATAASAEDGYKDSITWVIGNDQGYSRSAEQCFQQQGYAAVL